MSTPPRAQPPGAQPPQSLVDLAEAVGARLEPAGIRHRLRFVMPDSVNWWSLAVDFADGSVDDLYAAPDDSRIAVVPRHQELVSVSLAADYVAMCAGLMTETEWWGRLQLEQRARRDARRRHRWRRRFGLRR